MVLLLVIDVPSGMSVADFVRTLGDIGRRHHPNATEEVCRMLRWSAHMVIS